MVPTPRSTTLYPQKTTRHNSSSRPPARPMHHLPRVWLPSLSINPTSEKLRRQSGTPPTTSTTERTRPTTPWRNGTRYTPRTRSQTESRRVSHQRWDEEPTNHIPRARKLRSIKPNHYFDIP